MATDRDVDITIVETIHYYSNVPLSRLEEVAGATLAECEGNLETLMDMVQEHAGDFSGFSEYLEKHGDVQGQEWKAEFPTEEETDG